MLQNLKPKNTRFFIGGGSISDRMSVVSLLSENHSLGGQLAPDYPGKTIEVINRSNNQSFARPLSLATFDNKIAVGLTNGQIEIYDR